MAKSINLHPKHGLNPTIPVCIFCGKDKNEVALLGNAYKGEAPMRMILDAVPCDACKENFAKGVTFILASQVETDRFRIPIQRGAFIDGSHWVIKQEVADRMGITSPINLVLEKDAEAMGLINQQKGVSHE